LKLAKVSIPSFTPGGIFMLPEIQRFQKWLRRKAPYASTSIHYTNDLELFFAWLQKPINDVKVQDIDTFIDISQQQGYALTTINRRLAALRSFYHFLEIESADAPDNPVLPHRHFIRLGLHLPRDAEDPTIIQLFSVIHPLRDRTMFLLMLRCGLRVGEIRNLSIDDLYLDPAPGILPRLWLNGKGSKQRVAYLSKQTLSILRTYLATRPKTPEEAVFLNRFGKRLTVTGIQDRLAHYCRLANVWITCHQLRHTFARHMVEARVPITSIQRFLGHSYVTTTQIYLHVSDRVLQDDYDAAMQNVYSRFETAGGVQ
jgi:site-specific recombinase XerD